MKTQTQTKTQTPKMITQDQRLFLFKRLNRLGDFRYLMEFTRQITGGRTWNLTELTYEEAVRFMYLLDSKNKEVIRLYEETFTSDPPEVKERKQAITQTIFMISRAMGIIYGDTPEDHEMNKAKLNKLCRSQGPIKKGLTDMSNNELIDTREWFKLLYGSSNKSKSIKHGKK